MELGFVNFSNDERNKLYQVVQAIRESQAIDELGLGRIRDAFSNRLFPGMSYLHTRAKYYALLPSLFLQAERGNYKNPGEVKDAIIALEIKMTRQLVAGSQGADINSNGITGSSYVTNANNTTKFVKYDPVYIYSNALVTYGFVKSSGNLYQLIFERSLKHAEAPELFLKKPKDEETEDALQTAGDTQLFDTGGLSYAFDGKTPISINLTAEEADFIKSKIINSQIAKDSFLAAILRDDYPIVDEYIELGNALRYQNLSDEHRRLYHYSVCFSKFQYLLRLIYNYRYYTLTEQDEKAQKELDTYYKNKADWAEEVSTEKISEVISYVEPLVKHNATITFCRETLKWVNSDAENSVTKLCELITKQEKATKTQSRSKLLNPQKYKGINHGEAYFLNYRWELVSSIINEIRKGLQHE